MSECPSFVGTKYGIQVQLYEMSHHFRHVPDLLASLAIGCRSDISDDSPIILITCELPNHIDTTARNSCLPS